MELRDKQLRQLASVAKNIHRKHLLVIAVMITFFALLTFALLHNPHHDKKTTQSQTEALLLPPEQRTQAIAYKNKLVHHWKTITVKPRDTLSKIFRTNNISQSQLSDILALGKTKKILSSLTPENKIKLDVGNKHDLQELQYQSNLTTIIHVKRIGDQFVANIKHLPVEKQQAYSHGEIKASLFNAGLKSHLSSRLIMQMVDIFQWDIDFAKNIRPGDSFDVIYEEQYINGVPVAKGNILSAQFINRGKKYTAIRFTDPKGYTEYYSDTGRSLKKQFIRAPVKFTRISSYFKPKRWHPVLHRFRKHQGVDYAAPAGTPIKATGDGRVAFIGRKGGYGNAIIINHGNKVSTLYGHMLRFARHLHKNNKVKQGQVIGYVGMSGLATGYHVHYEFRINNVHRDPLKVKLPHGTAVLKKYRTAFNTLKNRLLKHMATFHQTELASRGKKQNA